MRAPTIAVLLLLAGCNAEEGAPENKGVTGEQIRRVMTPENMAVEDPLVAIEMQPLTEAESSLAGPGCRFLRGSDALVVATGGDAVARIAGTLRHFVQSAAADGSGIFLEDRRVSISIGRTEPAGDAAMLRITNRASAAVQSWAGTWTCVQ